MSEQQPVNPSTNDNATCPPDGRPSGPPREAGGTTGEGNLAPMQANRTGGATSGVAANDEAQKPARSGTVPPDA